MHTRLFNHIKNLLLPCLAFSMVAGFLSALLITAFKLAAEQTVHLSSSIYDAVRATPEWLPLLVLGAGLIGFAASLILSISNSCKGGGIPTSVAAIRGIVSLKWVAGAFLLPFSALLTFLCGVPLGTEGPCVQMGTALGDGVVKCLGSKKQRAWSRYIMTGGASSGFAIATSAPITAILFSMEELHKRFSPLLLTVASISVITAQATSQALSSIGIGTTGLFHLPEISAIPTQKLFAPLLVGLVCGLCSVLFVRFYHFVDNAMRKITQKLSIKVLLPLIFACVSIIGFFVSDALGSGHSLIDSLFETHALWYMLILVFLLRAVGMMVSNTAGATGGVFLPTLAFGALVGALCAEAMTAIGLIEAEHYLLILTLSITAFLGATSRIPVTACVFALEALGGINNILPFIIAVTVAFLTAEASAIEDFTDTMLDVKTNAVRKGKKPVTLEVRLTVKPDSFVVGKELCDVLWPSLCTVVSYKKASECRESEESKESDENCHVEGLSEGDIITLRYTTYDPAVTAEEIEALVGNQSEETKRIMLPVPVTAKEAKCKTL